MHLKAKIHCGKEADRAFPEIFFEDLGYFENNWGTFLKNFFYISEVMVLASNGA